MLPIALTLLFGAGLAAGLVLGLIALCRHLGRSSAPIPTRAATGAVGFAGLGFAALAGGFLFVALLATTTLTALLEHGPVRSIEVLRLDRSALTASALDSGLEEEALRAYQAAAEGLDPAYPVHVIVEYQGDLRIDRLHRVLDRHTDGRVRLVDVEPGERGAIRLDFGVIVRPDELEELEDELEGCQPFFDLPHAVRVEVREP